MSEQAKHTAGPWYVRDFRASEMARLGWAGPSVDRILIVNKTAAEIVESAGENCVIARIQFDNRPEALREGNLADAHLIAAAPDLLEALKRAYKEEGAKWNPKKAPEWVRMAVAAIAKAEAS